MENVWKILMCLGIHYRDINHRDIPDPKKLSITSPESFLTSLLSTRKDDTALWKPIDVISLCVKVKLLSPAVFVGRKAVHFEAKQKTSRILYVLGNDIMVRR